MTQSAILAASGSPGTTTGFKNRIINGNMVIDQRNGGAEVNPAVNATYYLDRWVVGQLVSGKFKIGQNAGSVTPPAGFTNYLGCTSLSAYSVGAGDYLGVSQKIEGYNAADLGWGTANAKTVALSFWVYSSLTGTFSGSILNSASNRAYIFSYSISSANTWTNISVTIPGDTSGTWLTTSGTGIEVYFNLGSGSGYNTVAGAWQGAGYRGVTGGVSVVGTSGATWYVTGCQFEVGTTATNFDFRSYGTELSLCQRYYQQFTTPTANNSVFANGYIDGTTQGRCYKALLVTMRTSPTSSAPAGSLFSVQNNVNGNAGSYSSWKASPDAIAFIITGSGYTAGQGCIILDNNTTSAAIYCTAEL